MTTDLILRIERYLDAAPRVGTRTEELGPFTLFVGAAHTWQYYARPRLGFTGTPTAETVRAVLERQDALDTPRCLEWVEEVTPGLATACQDAGLVVTAHPLLVHHDPLAVPVPGGIRIRRLSADDDALPASQIVTQLGFRHPGTERGTVGAAERDELVEARPAAADQFLRSRVAAGTSVVVVAEDERGVLAAGLHHPIGETSEIVGVATLPIARRQGLGAAVTDTLVADAFRRGVRLLFLSAGDDAVARVYERVGFRRVATAMTAEPLTPSG